MSSTVDDRIADKDLAALVAALDPPVVAMEELRMLPTHGRYCYRLRLADGRFIKARQLGSSWRAKNMRELCGYLDQRHVSRVLDRRGGALLIEWVEGEPLDPERLSPSQLRSIGRLHGSIHVAELARGPWRIRDSTLAYRADRLEPELRRLAGMGLVSPTEADHLLKLALDHEPENFAVGIAHGDFCPENLVLGADGRVVAIDNETIAVAALDHDLARTWYRWPLPRRAREAYFEGYVRYRSPDAYSRHFLYWAIMVLAAAALYRAETEAYSVSVPVTRLRNLIGDSRRASGSRLELTL